MTIEQTVEIPANRRLVIDVPLEVPEGATRVIIQFPAPTAADCGNRLSARFAGALRVSGARYEEMQETLREGREAWNRDIF